MTTLSKALLVVSVSGITMGCTVVFGNIVTDNIVLLMAMPLGAVAFGLFLIFHIMEKEMRQFDQEEAEKRQVAERHKAVQVSERKSDTTPGSLSVLKVAL